MVFQSKRGTPLSCPEALSLLCATGEDTRACEGLQRLRQETTNEQCYEIRPAPWPFASVDFS